MTNPQTTSNCAEINRDDATRRAAYEDGLSALSGAPGFMDALSDEQVGFVMGYTGPQTIGFQCLGERQGDIRCYRKLHKN